MSPAGLKAVAEEVGLEMVIICGDNMGDIFRRNALNLGLHVVQSPEAVADARDEDEFSFESRLASDRQHHQSKVYEPKPLTPRKTNFRRSGGIVAAGRREFRASIEREPRIEFPDASESRASLTTHTSKSSGQHRVDKDQRSLKPRCDTCACMPICSPHQTAPRPFAIHTFNPDHARLIYPRPGGDRQRSFVFTGRDDDDKQRNRTGFALEQG
jgi:hypothetical protein